MGHSCLDLESASTQESPPTPPSLSRQWKEVNFVLTPGSTRKATPTDTRTAACTAYSRAGLWGPRRRGSYGRSLGFTRASLGFVSGLLDLGGRELSELPLPRGRAGHGCSVHGRPALVFCSWRVADDRTAQHVATLRDLISRFPTTNPTPAGSGAVSGLSGEGQGVGGEEGGVEGADAEDQDGPDLAALMSQIRARYRLLCTSVGAPPRLVAAGKDGRDVPSAGVVEGIEGPMKGVDTRQLRF